LILCGRVDSRTGLEFFFDVEVVLDEDGVAQLCQQLEDGLEASHICGVVRGGVLEVIVEPNGMHFAFTIHNHLYYVILYVKNASSVSLSALRKHDNRSALNIQRCPESTNVSEKVGLIQFFSRELDPYRIEWQLKHSDFPQTILPIPSSHSSEHRPICHFHEYELKKRHLVAYDDIF
jgi:hypothetical protein